MAYTVDCFYHTSSGPSVSLREPPPRSGEELLISYLQNRISFAVIMGWCLKNVSSLRAQRGNDDYGSKSSPQR
jgi:hypothetical protein